MGVAVGSGSGVAAGALGGTVGGEAVTTLPARVAGGSALGGGAAVERALAQAGSHKQMNNTSINRARFDMR
jgi:hypothetical protein